MERIGQPSTDVPRRRSVARSATRGAALATQPACENPTLCFALENAEVKFVIRAFGEGYLFPGTSAGGIVDAARHGRADRLKEYIPIAELNAVAAQEFVIVGAGDDGPAQVVIRGPLAPIPLLKAAAATPPAGAIAEVHYILEPDVSELEHRGVGIRSGGRRSL